MQTTILDAQVRFVSQTFRHPLILSSGSIAEITEARVEVRARAGGHESLGRGSVYLSDQWSWPDPARSHADRDRSLRDRCDRISASLSSACGGEAAHPTELGLRLHEYVCGNTGSDGMPILARILCASPFDAAIHDAAGLALGVSAFDLYTGAPAIPTGDPLFPGVGAASAIRRMLLRPPRTRFDAWLIVGPDDTFDADGLGPWVRDNGYRAFKIKLMGRDSREDAARTAAVYRAAQAAAGGVSRPRITVDSNEGNPDAASVLDYLSILKATDPSAFDALEYLEQPTSRELTRHPNDWREVARIKPVLMDEGLTGFDSLPLAVEQGWSGFALKTCKGHSFALLAAAWANQRDLRLSLQDLTNPGLAAVHAALMASRLPTLNGLELNSPQYTPKANIGGLPRLAGLLDPRDGMHRIPDPTVPGLGSVWWEKKETGTP